MAEIQKPVADRDRVVNFPAPDTERVADSVEDAKSLDQMRKYFEGQPKVTIKTREQEWVQINGYTFIIQAGERVEVPEDVAKILEDAGRI